MKSNQVIQMYTAADVDASATIDIPDDGFLLAVFWAVMAQFGTSADGSGVRYQLSFGSTSAFNSNDARQVICNMVIAQNLDGVAANTSRSEAMRDVYLGDPGIEIFAGERIYLHVLDAIDGVNSHCNVDLLLNFKGGPTRRR